MPPSRQPQFTQVVELPYAALPTGPNLKPYIWFWTTDTKQLYKPLEDGSTLELASGGGGKWESYTPSNTNIGVGNGTQTARWTRHGNTIIAIYNLIFGDTTSISATARVGLPTVVAGADSVTSIRYTDASASSHASGIGAPFAGNSDVALQSSAGTNVSTTVPWTWAAGDSIRLLAIYEDAAAVGSNAPTEDLWHVVGAAGEPAFQNNWVNVAGYATAKFRKTARSVFVEGSVSTGTSGQTVFTLPAGYRPAAPILTPILTSGGVGYVEVAASGTVKTAALTGNAVTGSFFSISFAV